MRTTSVQARGTTQSTSSASQQQHQTTGSSRKETLRGLSYDQQVQMLSPEGGEAGGQDDANTTADANDTPGVLYANTSNSNLVRQTKEGEEAVEDQSYDWLSQIGFTTGVMYEAELTFDDLIMAGRTKSFPTAKAVGKVERTHDYLKTPGGTITESGTKSYSMRGGDGVGEPVSLKFSNNGALNLSRLARAAYNLAIGKGSRIVGPKVNHAGKTYTLTCTHTMGNAIEAAGAREHGFIGEYPMGFIEEKVKETVRVLCAMVAVGYDRVAAPSHNSVDYLNPTHVDATTFQADPTKNKNTLKIDDSSAWLTQRPEIVAATQGDISGKWSPSGHATRDTYLTKCPDFSGDLQALLDTCEPFISQSQGHEIKDAASLHAAILAAAQSIGATLGDTEMNLKLIKDETLRNRVEKANRDKIKALFAAQTTGDVKAHWEGLDRPYSGAVVKPGDKRVEGNQQNDEGMISA